MLNDFFEALLLITFDHTEYPMTSDPQTVHKIVVQLFRRTLTTNGDKRFLYVHPTS